MYRENTVIKTIESLAAPEAEKIKAEITKHGHTRVDNYFWMNNINNPKVVDYLKAENEYLMLRLRHTDELQKKLYHEICGRLKKEESSVPYRKNGYFYYYRYEAEKEYPVHCRRKDMPGAQEEILLDVNELAKGYKYINVTGLSVSPDNKILAFGVDLSGRRKYELRFKNLETGKILNEKISNTAGSIVWANDSQFIFYSKKDKTLRSYKIFRHKLNDKTIKDVEIYCESDPSFAVYVSKTKSGKFILLGSYSNTATEYRFLDADNPVSEIKLINPREKNHEYYVEHYKDKFLITSNDNARNFKLAMADIKNPSKENWEIFVPHNPQVLIDGIEVFKDYIAVQERSEGTRKIKIINLLDRNEKYIDFKEDSYTVYFTSNHEFESEELRFVYTSLTTPYSTIDFNLKSGERKLLKQEEVVGNFDKDNYISERIFAVSLNGTKIPISIVYKNGIVKDGNNPLLLTGYGSYGISSDPDFSSARLSLLDRGFIFAIAHIRGGQEFGRQWYEDGKLLKKKNTFTDFISCAEQLIADKYTNKEKLFAAGGSAGGLLMGAVVNMRPDLFKGIIAAVPFVDVVSTMLDESIPLTTNEYDEWGDPNKKEYYDYILSYSPYDNVERKSYPAMLVTTGLNDSQVQYWEPAKWVAKLREMKTDNNPLFLHINMSAGHSGSSGRFEKYKETALEYAFLLNLLGINE